MCTLALVEFGGVTGTNLNRNSGTEGISNWVSYEQQGKVLASFGINAGESAYGQIPLYIG